jgi:hypothetical protein
VESQGRALLFYCRFNSFKSSLSLQKSDSDLIFDDGLSGSLSDENSNHLTESSRTKLVSKRAVSDDSDKQTLEDSQIESDSGWLSRIKRSLSGLFGKTEEVVVPKSAESKDLNKSQDSFDDFNEYHKLSRRRRQSDFEDDDDDDDIESSGDDGIIEHSTASIETVSEALTPVSDDKYCE